MKRTARVVTLLLFTVALSAEGKVAVKRTNPDTLHKPRGYTHLVEASGGRTLYVSGQIALDREGNLVGKGDLKAQLKQVFENLGAALAAGGAGFEDVVKITIFMTDLRDIASFREARDRYFPKALPASTLVQVSRLAYPELLVEIEAVAVRE